ncbi:hypothetical protein CEXT_614701 [Caerostris extrusa]|uniref:Uncharacterized protein n=1 Tax=Caerostris extrusa TaxID=172846 RepID=A0AAV4PA09_CAEEX|nr:hypothetical protein CEXT_614701 [Caerostris extrusa]
MQIITLAFRDQYLKREVMERVSSISPQPLIRSWLQSNMKVRTFKFNHPERAQDLILKVTPEIGHCHQHLPTDRLV